MYLVDLSHQEEAWGTIITVPDFDIMEEYEGEVKDLFIAASIEAGYPVDEIDVICSITQEEFTIYKKDWN